MQHNVAPMAQGGAVALIRPILRGATGSGADRPWRAEPVTGCPSSSLSLSVPRLVAARRAPRVIRPGSGAEPDPEAGRGALSAASDPIGDLLLHSDLAVPDLPRYPRSHMAITGLHIPYADVPLAQLVSGTS